MPEIRQIRIDDVGIRDINIPRGLLSQPPLALPIYPPVTQQIGTPIVNIPGCVRAHKDNKENVNLKDEDDKGIMTLCDAGTPSFSPLDYDTNKLDLEQEPPPPPAYKPPQKPDAPAPPASPKPPKTEAPMPECPSRAQELKNPVGKIVEGNKKLLHTKRSGKNVSQYLRHFLFPTR